MNLDKFSKQKDKLANLYRAAYYIAVEAIDTGMELLKKTDVVFTEMVLETEKEQKYWAEKVLDKYYQLKIAQ